MNVPLDQKQQNDLHALQCRARALGLPFELHLDSNWSIVLVVDGRDFASIDDAAEHLSQREVTA